MHVQHGLPLPYVVVPRVVVKIDTNTIITLIADVVQLEVQVPAECVYGVQASGQ